MMFRFGLDLEASHPQTPSGEKFGSFVPQLALRSYCTKVDAAYGASPVHTETLRRFILGGLV